MKLIFPVAVRTEVREAIDYYDSERPGLGEHFWDEVAFGIRWILANSTVPRLRPGDFRRVNLHSYPYYIAYALRGDRVVLLAVGHGARRPKYWIDRKP
jgi:plasmid stabilization system protein ParE